MINHTYLRNKIADLQEQINRQKAINQRLISLMEEEMVIVQMPNGTQKRVPKSSVKSSSDGTLIVDGQQIPGATIDPATDLSEPQQPEQPEQPKQPQFDPKNPEQASQAAKATADALAKMGIDPNTGKFVGQPNAQRVAKGEVSTKPPVPTTKAPESPKEPEKQSEKESEGEPETASAPENAQDGLSRQAGSGAAAMGTQLAQAGVPGAGGNASGGGVNINMANMFAGQNAQGPVNVGGNQQVSSGAGNQTMNFGTMATRGGVAVGGTNTGSVATGQGKAKTTTSTNTTAATKKAEKKQEVKEEFNKKLAATSDELNRIFGRKDGGLRKS
jgi:hypothetical protein